MSYPIVEYRAKLEWLTGRYECRKQGAVQSAEWGMKNISPLFE